MADEDLRSLERRYKESGDAADEARFLAARLRAGELPEDAVARAADLGDASALSALGREGGTWRRAPWLVAARRVLARRLLHGEAAPLPLPRASSSEFPPKTLTVRALYDHLRETSDPVFADLLDPWLRGRPEGVIPDHLRRRNSDANPYTVTPEELWSLYALGRVNDQLLANFQVDAEHPYRGPQVTFAEYLTLFTQLGMRPRVHERFSPFHHEIVELEQSQDPSEPITLTDVLWPGLAFGDLLFSRAGVRVRAGFDVAIRQAAEENTLYFTHHRLRRQAFDLSYGWGSNSQWRTEFRRDYEDAEGLHYNVDGRFTIGERVPEDYADLVDVSEEDRIELLTHRCWLRRPDPEDVHWLWDDRWTESP